MIVQNTREGHFMLQQVKSYRISTMAYFVLKRREQALLSDYADYVVRLISEMVLYSPNRISEGCDSQQNYTP